MQQQNLACMGKRVRLW